MAAPPAEAEGRICMGAGDPQEDLVEPCACTGSLKYAHKVCLQRWVSRGDLNDGRDRGTCEICGEAWTVELEVPKAASPADIARARREWLVNVLRCSYFRLVTGIPRENDEHVMRTLGPFVSGPWNELAAQLNRPTALTRFRNWLKTRRENAQARRAEREARRRAAQGGGEGAV